MGAAYRRTGQAFLPVLPEVYFADLLAFARLRLYLVAIRLAAVPF
jgi:hypothetical protein